jgi:DNA invertase Pin-like site-specific DNA recombinase
VYSDHGRSGLNIASREGLNRLMADVEEKRADFSSLLVYDVSRWGRFQDVDESSYYEYVLKRAGIRVHYCAEQFENDGSMSSSVLKTLKRSMAAEYSRKLSVKPWRSTTANYGCVINGSVREMDNIRIGPRSPDGSKGESTM